MSFSSQSKFNLLRDQRKVANREVHGAQQGDSAQPVGRPEFLPPHMQEVQTPYEQPSRAPSTVGDDFDMQSVGFVSVVSNKTREGPSHVMWDERAKRFRDLERGVFVSGSEAAQLLSMHQESHERVQHGLVQDANHQKKGGKSGSVNENVPGMQT